MHSAARLRRSAIVERLRLREEWSALKGTNDVKPATDTKKKQCSSTLKKKKENVRNNKNEENFKNKNMGTKIGIENPRFARDLQTTNEVLRGVVALVDVGAETRALALRAALMALGATVMPSWSPLVTHLIWSHGGCRSTRAKARALACRLVSPLWVEACAASGRRLPESTFNAASRPSDLPSPTTLKRLLKKVEMENIPLGKRPLDNEEEKDANPRLRMSSEADESSTLDTSTDKSRNKSEESLDKSDPVESRVNTAPRRALPVPSITARPSKSRRKLFTQKEADLTKMTDDTDEDRTPVRLKGTPKLTHSARRNLARAERMARKLVSVANTHKRIPATDKITPNVVFTGMSRSERQTMYNAIKALNGRVQKQINRKTTHVLLGSCKDDSIDKTNLNTSKNSNANNTSAQDTTFNMASPHKMANEVDKMAFQVETMALKDTSKQEKVRTVNALIGAARGCRVLHAKWALDSLKAKRWLHHFAYEVPHLRKISQKAHVERKALGRMRAEYAYDVFNGMRVCIAPNAEQREAVTLLLKLCGAVVQNGELKQDGGPTRNGGPTQNGEPTRNGRLIQHGRPTQNGATQHEGLTQIGVVQSADYDIIVGIDEGQVGSKWVFDSVAASRMRTARRYVNKSVPSIADSFQNQNR